MELVVSGLAVSPTHIMNMLDRNNAAFEAAYELADRSTGEGHRTCCWWFASELKGYRGFRNLESWEAVALLDELLVEHGGGWELLPDTDVWDNEVDPRSEFARVWPEITKPLEPVFHPADALVLVERWPLSSTRWTSDLDAGYRRAVSLIFWYATLLDADGRFFMSCITLGKVLECSHVMALTYLQRGQQEGLLERVEKGRQGRASRYRFDLEAVTLAADEGADVIAIGGSA